MPKQQNMMDKCVINFIAKVYIDIIYLNKSDTTLFNYKIQNTKYIWHRVLYGSDTLFSISILKVFFKLIVPFI